MSFAISSNPEIRVISSALRICLFAVLLAASSARVNSWFSSFVAIVDSRIAVLRLFCCSLRCTDSPDAYTSLALLTYPSAIAVDSTVLA